MDKLDNANRKLRQSWERNKPLWNDKARHDFEEMHWNPIHNQGLMTEREVKKVLLLIKKAKRTIKERR